VDELKPCPFCGGAAECYRYHEPAEAHFPAIAVWRVRCTECHLGGEGICTGPEAIAAWNRRKGE
jgi:Lar family restriction alleviation protein